MQYTFASFVVNESSVLLTKNNQIIELEPKIFSLLCYFCQNPQRAISRDELIEQVWDGRIVSNAAINRAIGELRKIVEEDVKKPSIITTVSKVGYAFNANVVIKENPANTSSSSNDITPKIAPKIAPKVESNTIEKTQIKENKKRESPQKSDRSPWRRLFTFLILAVTLLMAGYLIFSSQLFDQNHHTAQSIELDNKSKAPLTHIKGMSFRPQLNHKNSLLFLHKTPSSKSTQLWIQQQGQKAEALTDDSYYYTWAIWGGDSTVFASRFNNLAERHCEVVKIDINTLASQKVFDCGERALTYLAFDPRSNTLYFNDRNSVSEPYVIKSIKLNTQRIQQITLPPPDGNSRGDFLFALSPSYQQLAIFEYQQDGGALLKTLPLSSPAQVTKHKAFHSVDSLAWVDEHNLVIAEHSGIQSYNLTSQKITSLIESENVTQATYSAPTNTLAYVRFDSTQNIYAAKLAKDSSATTSNHSALTSSPYLNFMPVFANNSNQLAYFSTDSGELAIQLQNSKQDERILKLPETIRHFGNIVWSQDDSAIFASINSKVFRYDLASKSWQVLDMPLSRIHFIEVIDNKNIIVSSDDGGDWQLWQVNLVDMDKKQVTEFGGYSAHYADKTDELFYSKYSQTGLYRKKVSSNEEALFSEAFAITDWNKWQLRGSNLYFWQNDGIVSTDTTSGEQQLVWPFKQSEFGYFTISSDETTISFSLLEESKAGIWQSKLRPAQ